MNANRKAIDLDAALDLADGDPLLQHVLILHNRAGGIAGKLVVASYGQDPATGIDLAPRVLHFDVGDVGGIVSAIKDLATEKHRNIYMPWCVMRADLPAGKKGGEADIVAVLGLVGDFDDANAAAYESRLPLPPSYVLETSPGRFQTFYWFNRPLPMAEAKALATRLKLHAGCDHGTADVSHIWRVPGTLNWPNKKKVGQGRPQEPQLVHVAQPWNGRLIDPADLDRVLPEIPVEPETDTTTDADSPIDLASLSDHLQSVIVDGPPEGKDRSTTFAWVIKSLAEQGHSEAAIHSLLAAHPDGIAEKFASRGDLRERVAAEFKKAPKSKPSAAEEFAKADQSKPNEDDGKQEQEQPKTEQEQPKAKHRFTLQYSVSTTPLLDQTWLIEDTLPTTGVGFMYGRRSQGKTFLVVDAAYAVARGIPWLSLPTEQGPTLLVSTEGTMRNRVAAYKKHHEIEGQDVPFVFLEDEINLFRSDADTKQLVLAAQEVAQKYGKPVRLIAIDHLANVLAGGEEDKARDIAIAREHMSQISRATGAFVLMLAHPGKSEAAGIRGSYSIECMADAILHVGDRAVTIDKVKDAEDGRKYGFDLERIELGANAKGKMQSSCVVISTGVPRKALDPNTVSSKALTVLEKMDLNGGKVLTEDWSEEFTQTHYKDKKPGSGERAFKRARDYLVAKNFVRVEGEYAWTVQNGW